jgi:hypothetical protein
MPLTEDGYLRSITSQVGFEKQSFDHNLNLSLVMVIAVVGWFAKLHSEPSETDWPQTFVVCAAAIPVLSSLFLRAARAYRNYYRYLYLCATMVRSAPLSEMLEVSQVMEKVDLQRGDLGGTMLNWSLMRAARHVLVHTEFVLLLGGVVVLGAVSAVIIWEWWVAVVGAAEAVILTLQVLGLHRRGQKSDESGTAADRAT